MECGARSPTSPTLRPHCSTLRGLSLKLSLMAWRNFPLMASRCVQSWRIPTPKSSGPLNILSSSDHDRSFTTATKPRRTTFPRVFLMKKNSSKEVVHLKKTDGNFLISLTTSPKRMTLPTLIPRLLTNLSESGEKKPKQIMSCPFLTPSCLASGH